jgi:hypothetical protein
MTIGGLADVICYVIAKSKCLRCLNSGLYEEDKEVR